MDYCKCYVKVPNNTCAKCNKPFKLIPDSTEERIKQIKIRMRQLLDEQMELRDELRELS
jgi:hypothetical protein